MDVTILFVFALGLVSSLIGGAIGGGGALIALPGLILIGLPPHIAIGTNKLGNIGTAISTIYTFEKAHLVRHKLVIPFAILAGIGALIGANIVTFFDEETLGMIVGAFILAAVPFLLLNKGYGMKHKKTSKKKHELGYLLFFFVAIYIGFLGAAGGFIVVMILVSFFGLTFLEANATFKIPWLVIILTSLAVFAYNGYVNWLFGAVLLVGRLIGGYLGSQLAVHQGNNFVKYALSAVILVTSVKLIFF